MRALIVYFLFLLCVPYCGSAQNFEKYSVYQGSYSNSLRYDFLFLPGFVKYEGGILFGANQDCAYADLVDQSWFCVPVSPPRLEMKHTQWVVTPSYLVFSFWDKYTSGDCSVYVYDKFMNYIRSAAPAFPERREYDQALYAYGDTLVAHGTNGVGISIDGAQTWKYHSTTYQSPSLPYSVLRDRNGAFSVFSLDSVFTTYDVGVTWKRDARWLPGTRWFYQFSDSTWLTSVDEKNDFVARMYYSRDAGMHWTLLDTLRCSNTGRAVVDAVRAYNVLWYNADDGRLTLLLGDGDVLTTTDSMRTWIDRGNIGTFACGGRNVTTTHDNNAMVATYKGLWRIPFKTSSPAILFASGKHFGSALQLDDSVCFATANRTFVRSSDGGRTWMSWYEPIDYCRLRKYPFGLYSAQISTVSAYDNSNVTISTQFTQTILNRDLRSGQWKLYNLDILPGFEGDDLSDQYVSGRSMWAVGKSLFAVSETNDVWHFLVSTNNGLTFDTLGVGPSGRIRYVNQFDSSIYVADDSLRVLRSNEWSNIGNGLPCDQLSIQRVECLTKLSNGQLLVGLSGTRLTDTNGITTDIGGGLWRRESIDTTWTKVGGISDAFTRVMALHYTSAQTVLATVSAVSVQEPFEDIRQDDIVIVRSNDNGKTWNEVFRDIYSGPSLLNPLLFAETKNGAVYASGSRGRLLRSDDDGATWRDVENWWSVANINDMSVDTNDVVYVATDSGLIVVRSTATDIVNDESSRYLHLAVSPNPSITNTTISIQNVAKTPGIIHSLSLVNTLGQRSIDLTSRLREQSNSNNIRLEIDTAQLPIGTYVAFLRVGIQTRSVVLCVVR